MLRISPLLSESSDTPRVRADRGGACRPWLSATCPESEFPDDDDDRDDDAVPPPPPELSKKTLSVVP